jgi:hypothetical protein
MPPSHCGFTLIRSVYHYYRSVYLVLSPILIGGRGLRQPNPVMMFLGAVRSFGAVQDAPRSRHAHSGARDSDGAGA